VSACTVSGSRAWLWLLTTVALVGCEDPNQLNLGDYTVVNLPDRFEFLATGLNNVSDGARFLWTITGTQASVDITQAITKGSARLQLKDPNGTVVYSELVKDDSDGTTSVGGPGIWQVDLVLTEVSGDIAFRLDRVSP
jgi:hypothetical protein